MTKFILFFVGFVFSGFVALAQPLTREELEKQRQQLKKEIEQTEKMLNANKKKTKENFVQWKLINDKVNLQDRMIDNINRDINLLNDNIYLIQLDINRYDRLLDTLKQEYAKSMVYAYKNRSSYDFMNFIFSAASFNDAIKRISYLKSYRNYREMQGQNILRTQEMRRQRIEELGGTKQKKNIVLQIKDKEMAVLEVQKQEKDKIMNELKKQGKELNSQLTANKKKIARLNNVIAAAIKREVDLAKKTALAKAAADKANAKKSISPSVNTDSKITTPVVKTSPAAVKKQNESVLLNSEESIALNANFEKNRGVLPWPVDKGLTLMHFGSNKLPSNTVLDNPGITIGTDIGASVKSIFDGVVSTVVEDDFSTVIILHGRYFTTYSNLTGVVVKKGQNVKMGQVIGKAAANLDGVGAVEFVLSNERNNIDPAKWLRSR